MRRTYLIAAAMCTVMVMANGCAGKGETKATTAGMRVEQTMQESVSGMSEDAADDGSGEGSDRPAENVQGDGNDKKAVKEMAGVLEEKKNVMIIVNADSDGESYVFPIEEGMAVQDLKTGDKVLVTYTGDPSPDSEEIEVVSVKKM